jgi:hypothetical protein
MENPFCKSVRGGKRAGIMRRRPFLYDSGWNGLQKASDAYDTACIPHNGGKVKLNSFRIYKDGILLEKLG